MRWIYADDKPIEESLKNELQDKLALPAYMIKAFANRGIDTFEKAKDVFEIDSAPLYPPNLFEDMDKSVERILKAVKAGEKIVIYGDYDVDGVTATVMLFLFTRDWLKYDNIAYYIPHRQDEGYGMNLDALKSIKDGGAGLIISVDCGISAKKEVEYCANNGIDVIITDHHIPDKESVPDRAFAIINPKVSKKYPEKELSGAGVAYKLVCAIASAEKINPGDEFLDFAALGTIADIVPLTRENRIIARRGFKKIANTTNPGLKALKQVSAIKPDAVITTYHVGFILGPRINAAGRLEHAEKAVRLFVSRDREEIERIANELNSVNEERKALTNRTHEEALAKLKDRFDEDEDFVIVLYDEGWNAGIVGLVASKVLRGYNRPTFILTKSDDGFIHGSARSVNSVNIYEAIKASHKHLERYGGHRLAAGITLREENLHAFIKTINEYLKTIVKKEQFEPVLLVDSAVDEPVSLKDIKFFDRLAPWGEGNPKPVFSMAGVEIKDVKLFKSNTMKFYGSHKGRFYNFLYYGYDEEDAQNLKSGNFVDVAFTPTVNVWRDEESLVLEVSDYKTA
ncbi:MAG: single-stranded-DNA-specific exonuclease RecJ [Spirochaetia bacterium]|nr:single-stranded-DNA-specific exonuclease RecJ [Spirochaetia bacterium]